MLYITLTDEAWPRGPFSTTIHRYVEIDTALELAVAVVTGGAAFARPERRVGTQWSRALHSAAVLLREDIAKFNVEDCHQKSKKNYP